MFIPYSTISNLYYCNVSLIHYMTSKGTWKEPGKKMKRTWKEFERNLKRIWKELEKNLKRTWKAAIYSYIIQFLITNMFCLGVWKSRISDLILKTIFSLGFSVTIFCIEALLAILILMARRSPAVGGELGGPKLFKTISASIFVFFWTFYVFISALEAYEVIKPGF